MAENTQQPEAKPAKKTNKGFLIVLAILVIGGAWFGISKYNYAQHNEDTDDAQIDANVSPVIPRVSGYVKEVRVKDNQRVKKGDTLIILDDRDYQIKVAQAEAALFTAQNNVGVAEASTNAAEANVGTYRANIGTIDAQIETAKVNVTRATQDYNRYANLIKDHSITQQQFEQADAAKQVAERQLQVLQEQRKQAAAQTNAIASQSQATGKQISVANATIKQRQVEVDDAKLMLSYTVITAAQDGLISKVFVQPGQFLSAGQSYFSIIANDEVWVTANFKETQLDKMKVGQKVTVVLDAFPGRKLDATVASFAPTTGAKMALLPPDNSTGNFVKVVQRVPVKITFDNPQDSTVKLLRAGMNVEVDVHLD